MVDVQILHRSFLTESVDGTRIMNVTQKTRLCHFPSEMIFEDAEIINTTIVIGQIVASVPIGWLADHMDRRLLLIANAIVILICALLLPVLLHSPILLYVMLFLWGSASAGLYTLGMVRLGEVFAGRDLGSATAVFILITQIGSVAGPVLGGAGMDAWNPHGFVAVTAAVSAAFCAFALWRYVTVEKN